MEDSDLRAIKAKASRIGRRWLIPLDPVKVRSGGRVHEVPHWRDVTALVKALEARERGR